MNVSVRSIGLEERGGGFRRCDAELRTASPAGCGASVTGGAEDVMTPMDALMSGGTAVEWHDA